MSESLLLKWGTIKGWSDLSDASVGIVKRYFQEGVPASCATDRPNEDRKEILCELIDQLDGEIQNDWSGEILSKDAAKEYVRSYGANP